MKSRLLITISLFLFGLVSCVESEISLFPNLPDEQSEQQQDEQQEEVTQTASISGTAIDVFTGVPLANTWLCLEDGTTCTQTDGDGNYTFNDVPYGEHTITPFEEDLTTVKKCPADGTNDCQGFTFTLDENTPTTNFQISSGDSTKLSGSMTIITTWEDSLVKSYDIDSHLIIPLSGDCFDAGNSSDNRYFEDASANPYFILDYVSILSGLRPFAYDSIPFATLDLDDLGTDSGTHSVHMETMKIKLNGDNSPSCNGTYHFYLNNYDATPGGSDNFSDAKVKVRVLVNGSVQAEFSAEGTGGNKFWGVFDIAENGTVTPMSDIDSVTEYNDDCELLYPEINGSGKCEDSDN